ncbi:hypothetical protein BJV77DRAFT_965496 [Russula vinacea]|nr:hypothetical protein BJV77DRAFT_965496 [Russula vinacea]
MSLIAKDPSSDDDDTILRKRFPMRRYNLENDGRLTNFAKALDLIAGSFGDDDLCRILNAQLDTLAISPQAKQGVIPALVGIAKLTGVQSRGASMPQSQTRPVSASSCPDGGVTVDAYPAGASVGYQRPHYLVLREVRYKHSIAAHCSSSRDGTSLRPP